MSKAVQRRRGTTTEHTTFTGALGELTVDTTKNTVVVHDGAAAGGYPLLREDGSNSALSLGSAGTPSLKFTGDPNTGIYSPGADQVAISTGGSERARIDSSGRLLVGTSTARANFFNTASGQETNLQLEGTGYAGSSASFVRNSNNSSGPYLILGKTRGTTTGSNSILSAGDDLGVITFQGADGSELVEAASIFAELDATPAANSMPGRLVFSTTADGASSPTERMRIDSAGNVSIGGASSGARLLVISASNGVQIGASDGTSSQRVGYCAFGAVFSGSSSNHPYIFVVNDTERARIDSSGRLLVGTSTSITGASVEANNSSTAFRFANPAEFGLWRANGSAGSPTVVADGNILGRLYAVGYDGASYITAARIEIAVDGTPGTNDMPSRIVLSTTLDGANSPTEAFRITNDRVHCYNQAAPAAVDTTATLTVANLKTGIITSSTAAAVTMTLPTGTDTEAGFSGIYTNMTFEWSVINTGATNAVTVQGGTGHTLVGSGTVAASNSGRFASRRTAANTFVTYRLSS